MRAHRSPAKRALSDSGSDAEAGMEPAEAKPMKRMRRNRESAAMSRERKKAYIEELELKLASLNSTVEQLRCENEALRAGRGLPAAVDPFTGGISLPESPAMLFG